MKITYIISDIDKSLHFEWIAENLNKKRFSISFILLNPGPSSIESYLKSKGFDVERIKCRGKQDWVTALYKIYLLLKKINPT